MQNFYLLLSELGNLISFFVLPTAVRDTQWFWSAWRMRTPSHRLSVTLLRIKVNTVLVPYFKQKKK